MQHRAERDCIFKSNEHIGNVCSWAQSAIKEHDFALVDACDICQSQSQVRVLSGLLGETKELRRTIDRKPGH